jgi:predicted DNA-binding mobile mystery protein A
MKLIRRAATARRHLDQRFRVAGDTRRHLAVPAKGWIRAIRDSLGMTASQLAMRMGVSQSTLSEMEKAEARGAIQLSSLKRAAEAMNCTLVYALVPTETLETCFQTRAHAVAIEQLRPVEQTMRLENQLLDPEATREQLDDYIRTELDPRIVWAKRP